MTEEKMFFHESLVKEFTKYPTSIKLSLKRVVIENEVKNVELLFEGIKKLEADHQPAEFPLMATENGEVVFLEFNDNKVELLIRWDDFSSHTFLDKFYFI